MGAAEGGEEADEEGGVRGHPPGGLHGRAGGGRLRLPILAGPLRGTWWLAGSRGKLGRVLTGRYEPRQTRHLIEHLRAGDTMLDVGAHAGYYTLLASTLVGTEGQVWAFEPAPRNARYLRGNVDANGRSNVRVTEAAVSDEDGTARFGSGTGTGTGRLTEEGDLEVRTLTLDGFCERHDLDPSMVKIDVEGAEARVLRGAAETIRTSRPAILLSTHGAGVRRTCVTLLRSAGYRVEPMSGDEGRDGSELLCLAGRA